MKRVVLIFLSVILLFSFATLSVSAISEETAGLKFTRDGTYITSGTLSGEPNTFEAWVRLPKNYNSRAGVIFGNYGFIYQNISFEIIDKGTPRLYYINDDGVLSDIVFHAVSIPTGQWVHLAIVRDIAAGEVRCYVDGVLKETKACTQPYGAKSLNGKFTLGGDFRSDNAQYFKGEIANVALFSDVRNETQINQDLKAIDTEDANLLLCYEMSANDKNKSVEDKSTNQNDAVFNQIFITSKEKIENFAYSFAVVGDTQVITNRDPMRLSYIYDWIVANKEAKKIEYVFGLGDITDANTEAEWEVAKKEIDKLNGLVPYSLVRGNHDGNAEINKYFSNEVYNSQFEGFYQEGAIENSWRTFDVCGHKYLLITIDYGASDDILNWAGNIISSHPDRKVIITTHCYLYRDGTTLDSKDVGAPNPTGDISGAVNNGDQMWDKLVSKYENIILVISGHDPSDDVVVTQSVGVHGNTVTQMLVDPQGTDVKLGSMGLVAMLYFSEDGNCVQVEYYSTTRKKFYKSNNQFELTLNVEHPIETEEPKDTVSPDCTEEPIDRGCGGSSSLAFVAVAAIGAVILLKKRK